MVVVDESSNRCSICLTAHAQNEDSADDYWELGLPFMAQYYVIHDYENLRMGFVPFETSTKELPIAVNIEPTWAIDTEIIGSGCDTIFGMSIWAFALMIVACVAVLGAGIWAAIVFCYRTVLKGNRKSEKSLPESTEVIDLLLNRLQNKRQE